MACYDLKMKPRACPICGCDEVSSGGEAGLPEFHVTCQLAECGWAGFVDTVREPGRRSERPELLDAFDSVARGATLKPDFCPMCTRQDVKVLELGQRSSGHFDVRCQAAGCGWQGSITEV